MKDSPFTFVLPSFSKAAYHLGYSGRLRDVRSICRHNPKVIAHFNVGHPGKSGEESALGMDFYGGLMTPALMPRSLEATHGRATSQVCQRQPLSIGFKGRLNP